MATSASSHWNKGTHQVGMSLPQGEKAQAMHIWINSARWVARVACWWLYYFSVWSDNRDMYLIPVGRFQDLLCKDYHLGFCEVFKHNRKAAETHGRHPYKQNTDVVSNQHPHLDQSRNIFSWAQMSTPWVAFQLLRWTPRSIRLWWGSKDYGRDIVWAHHQVSRFWGQSAKVVAAPWEFQIRPCEGMDIRHHLWMDHFISHHLYEDFGMTASFDPKAHSWDLEWCRVPHQLQHQGHEREWSEAPWGGHWETEQTVHAAEPMIPRGTWTMPGT